MNYLIFAVVFTLVSLSLGQSFKEMDMNSDDKLEYPEFESLFSAFDLDGNGIVTVDEVVKMSGLTDAQASSTLSMYDLNRDGKVELSEIKPIFDKIDANGDGVISEKEWNRAQAMG